MDTTVGFVGAKSPKRLKISSQVNGTEKWVEMSLFNNCNTPKTSTSTQRISNLLKMQDKTDLFLLMPNFS
jgi:hypothetical protein